MDKCCPSLHQIRTDPLTEKPALDVEKWLEMPRDKRIIMKMIGKAQFES
jgi:hypothetical protein